MGERLSLHIQHLIIGEQFMSRTSILKGWAFGITGDLDEGIYLLDSENSDIDTLIFYKE